jgi:hypothetical protein
MKEEPDRLMTGFCNVAPRLHASPALEVFNSFKAKSKFN